MYTFHTNYIRINEEYMKLAQIASLMNKNVKTIRRWAEKAGTKCPTIMDKMSQASTTCKAADFDVNETIEIIKGGGNDNVAGILLDNINLLSKGMDRKDTESRSITDRDKAVIAETVAQCFTKLIPVITEKQRLESKPKQITLLPEVPELSDSDKLNMIVREFVETSSSGRPLRTDYMNAFNKLYKNLSYRFHINLKLHADNDGLSIIAYLEREDLLKKAISIALEIFQ